MSSQRASVLSLLVLTVAMLAGLACSSSSTAAEARSDKERLSAAGVPEADITEANGGNDAFTVDLYKALRDEAEGNMIFSPYSISAALAMTSAGARGETESEMAAALHFLPQERLHPALNALDLGLRATPERPPDEEGEPLELNIANSIWGERSYEFAAAFLDVLAQYYGAGLRLADFRGDPDGSRQSINGWVSEQTQERIPELLPEGIIDGLTRLVLVNAIFFHGSWRFPFDETLTQDAPFFLLDRSEVSAPRMSLSEDLAFGEIDDAQVVSLPYVGGQARMLLVVPDEGEFESFEERLDADVLAGALDSLRSTRVQLKMPKFEFASDFSLAEVLSALGMPQAFDPERANFTGMPASGLRELYVSAVVHKANVTLDERGTEAAAATGVIARLTSGPQRSAELAVDRPFLFFILGGADSTILFAGRVLDPTAE